MRRASRRLWECLFVFLAFLMLFFLFPRLIVYLSNLEWIQNLILGSVSTQPIVSTDNINITAQAIQQARVEQLQSLWGSISVPVFSTLVAVYTLVRQIGKESLKQKNIQEKWVGEVFAADKNCPVTIENNRPAKVVVCQEKGLSTGYGTMLYFKLPLVHPLPSNAKIIIKGFSTVYQDSTGNIKPEIEYEFDIQEPILSGNLEFAIAAGAENYVNFDFLKRATDERAQLTIKLNLQVEHENSCFQPTIEYVLKRQSHKVFVSEMTYLIK